MIQFDIFNLNKEFLRKLIKGNIFIAEKQNS